MTEPSSATPPPPPPPLPPPPLPPRLPVWATVKAAFRIVLADHLNLLPRAALVPLLISLVLLLLQVRFGIAPGLEGADARRIGPLGLLLALLAFGPYVIFAVAWHRLVLLGPERALPQWLPRWDRRHWLFLGSLFAIGLVMMVVVVAVTFGALLVARPFLGPEPGATTEDDARLFGVVLGAVIAVAIFWLAARFCLALPARAVDRRVGLAESWRLSRGQGLRILAAFALVQIIIAVPASILGELLGAAGGAVGAINELAEAHLLEAAILFAGLLPLLALGFFASYLATALGVTVLSIAFKTIAGWRPDAPPPPE